MAKAAKSRKRSVPMIVFSRARDIPFNRIRLSDSNVRETGVEAGLDELTQDIERREDLIQGLNVRAILDADGNETGDFETPAGGRRYRSIARLVTAGRFPADGLVPCIVKKADAKTSAVDDSLAENIHRLALHPLDQFRAFKRMVDGGMSTEEVAAAYFTTPRYVEQRLRLSAVSPKLLEIYAGEGMTLAMLEAFTVNPDHARQEQVWETTQQSYNRQPWHIRQMLTQTTVPASDKRARFVGIDAYVAAGGPVLRDLFEADNGGWLEDVPLLDRLVADKLKAVADKTAAEGWKWINVDINLPYGHDHGLRPLTGTGAELTDEERATREALREEYERIEAEYGEVDGDLPKEIDQRLGEIETALDELENRPVIYDPADIARAGVFISIDRGGDLIVDRGYVRPEDEAPLGVEGDGAEADGETGGDDADGDPAVTRTTITIGGDPVEPEEDEGDAIKPLPERLVIELTAHRTLALRNAVAGNPHVAMTALLHRLVLDAFRERSFGGCVEASVRQVYLSVQEADLKDSLSANGVSEREQAWKADIPFGDDEVLWSWLDTLDDASRLALLAHCVSYGINALFERPNPYVGNGISQRGLDQRLSEADRLARATGLDMVDVGWRPTVANYLGRVTKARILEAVREGAGERAAQLIDHLKKPEMAKEAERLLADTGWLPEPLRLIEQETTATQPDEGQEADLPEFLAGDDEDRSVDDEVTAHAVAAE
ncbi:MAG: chromosome partitioning protein ParB [Mesorhizobium sp.]|uniref:ParB/RepB/Spo0J family partition protein n=1 Tax=Mesorhizobium sp. TaxID=1871066 RepID=UPI000FE54C3F|nr:ParB/RepB/Spo0J family partition protein [Mesorhizobium sp.]RWH46686.1 MAG: chromosome partitioning protein ParB [Mesorhizobium sp.]